jgi:hypothetical protein
MVEGTDPSFTLFQCTPLANLFSHIEKSGYSLIRYGILQVSWASNGYAHVVLGWPFFARSRIRSCGSGAAALRPRR